MVIDIREVSEMARTACGNGEVGLVYLNEPDTPPGRTWYIVAGVPEEATGSGLGPLEIGGYFSGHGETFDEALVRIKQDIQRHPTRRFGRVSPPPPPR